jgi:hypothetical protein
MPTIRSGVGEYYLRKWVDRSSPAYKGMPPILSGYRLARRGTREAVTTGVASPLLV